MPTAPSPNRVFRQKRLFCFCGQATPVIAGRCSRCYWAERRSRRFFAGQREFILDRDRSCRGCGAGNRLVVHHRQPGVHSADLLITLCAACHARVHRLFAIRHWIPDELVPLWTEQHPGVPVQLQFQPAHD